MALAADIRTLRDRVLADLNAAHDYYADTIIAWNIVGEFIAAGRRFSTQNKTTGTVTTQADLAGKARGYVAEQLTEATFQQFISIFENFFFDILRLWLMAYPQSLGGKKLDFQAVLDSPDKDGQRIDIPEHYHRETWELLRKVVTDISNAAIAKVP